MDFFNDLWDMLANTDPGILTFAAVVFLPGFIIAGAIVYFIIRGIVRSMLKPSQDRKQKKAHEREQRKWDDFYAALDKCTVKNFSYLPADAALIKEAANYYSSQHRRKLSKRELFICYKRLEQLNAHRIADLAWLYVDHFSETDRDAEAALKYTGLLADDGDPKWMMDHAVLLDKYRYDDASRNRAMNLYRKLAKTDGDRFIPLLVNTDQGPEAAWRLSKLCLNSASVTEEAAKEGHDMILLAALHDHRNAIEFIKKEYNRYVQNPKSADAAPALRFSMQLMTLLKDNADPKEIFDLSFMGARYGFPASFTSASTYYPAATGDALDLLRYFYLNRLGTHLGSSHCMLMAGLGTLTGAGNVPKDGWQGRQWVEQAADMGYAKAMHSLGELLILEDRITEAIQWWEKGAAQGDADCAQDLAYLYVAPKSTVADPEKAEHWKAVAEKLRKEEENKRRTPDPTALTTMN